MLSVWSGSTDRDTQGVLMDGAAGARLTALWLGQMLVAPRTAATKGELSQDRENTPHCVHTY